MSLHRYVEEHPPSLLGVEFVSVEGEWTERTREKYFTRSATAVSVQGPMDDLRFLVELPGLQRVMVSGRVKDDSAVYDVATLTELSLMDRCRRPFLGGGLPRLERLVVDWRRGLDSLGEIPTLRYVDVFGAAADTFTWARSQSLRVLRADGKGQVIPGPSMSGLPALRALDLDSVQLDGFMVGAEFPSLEFVNITWGRRPWTAAPLDLGPLKAFPRLRGVSLYGVPVASLGPLAEVATLEWCDVVEAVAVDGGPAPVAHLPRGPQS